MNRWMWARIVLGLSLAACSGRSATMDSSERAAAGANAGRDAASPDAGAPAFDLPPTPLPLADGALLPISTGEPQDYAATAFVRPADGALVTIFERFSGTTGESCRLLSATSRDGHSFDAPTPVDLGTETAVCGPHVLVRDGVIDLYFVAGAFTGAMGLYRSRYADGRFGARERLALGDAYAGPLAWPVVATLDDGQVALGYTHYDQGALQLAVGRDGLRFGAPIRMASGTQGRPATFATGELVYSYQDGAELSQTAYVRVSSDGQSWRAPRRLSEILNVHDTMPFRRRDGAVDVYYIAQGDDAGFALWRRSIERDGALGPEERMTSASGSFTQPHPHRLPDQRIFLTFAKQVTSNVDTDACGAFVNQDAPR